MWLSGGIVLWDAGKKLIGSIAAQKEDELASLATFLSFRKGLLKLIGAFP